MKKPKVNFLGKKEIKGFLNGLWSDFGLLFSKRGWHEIIDENHHLHYFYTGIACFVASGTLTVLLGQDASVTGQAVAAMLIGGWVNYEREVRKQKQGGRDKNGKWRVPFSWADIRFGTYGAIHFSVIGFYVAKAIFKGLL